MDRGLVETWAQSFIALYEVQEVRRGVGIALKNLHTDEKIFVHDVSLSKSLALWDCCFCRVVPGERGLEMTGVGVLVARHNLETMLAWLKSDKRRKALAWPEYFKENWLRIRRKAFTTAREWRESLSLANTDGEELIFSNAIYAIESGSPLAALEGHPELEAAAAARAGDGGTTRRRFPAAFAG